MNVLDMLQAPWAIEPEILTEMCAIYARHRNGDVIDIKGIEAATGRTLNNQPKPYQVQDNVALIPVEGVLSKRMGMFAQICGGMSYTTLQQELAQALSDPDATSIILTIDSPGGTVDGVEAAVNAIYAARSQKPIAAYVDGKATSAAYWIGSAASQMYIGSDADVVGSIGVIMTHVDTSVAEALRGVKYTDLAAGRYKATGTPHAPLSTQDRSTMQDQLDQLYGNFVDTVARNRGVDSNTVHSKMADGRVFLGARAIDAGLVDGKATLPELIQRLSKGRKAGSSAVIDRLKDRNLQRSAGQRPGAHAPSTPVNPAAIATSTAATAPRPSVAEHPIIVRLRELKSEETSILRLLAESEAGWKSASSRLIVAQQSRSKDLKQLESLVSAKLDAESMLRELRGRLAANDQAQREALCA